MKEIIVDLIFSEWWSRLVEVVFWDVGAWELKGMHAVGRGGVDNMGETDGPCFLSKKKNQYTIVFSFFTCLRAHIT